jgi:ribosomal protein L14
MYHFLSNNCCILLKYVQVNTMKKNFTPNTNTIITYKNIVFLSLLFYYIMIFKVSYLKDFYNSLAVKAVCKGFQISLKYVAVETAKYQFNFHVSIKCLANSKIHSPVLLKALTNKRQVAGTYLKFSKPGCALFKKNNQPLANIVHGVFDGEYRPQDHLKSVSSKPYCDNMPIIKLFLILIISLILTNMHTKSNLKRKICFNRISIAICFKRFMHRGRYAPQMRHVYNYAHNRLFCTNNTFFAYSYKEPFKPKGPISTSASGYTVPTPPGVKKDFCLHPKILVNGKPIFMSITHKIPVKSKFKSGVEILYVERLSDDAEGNPQYFIVTNQQVTKEFLTLGNFEELTKHFFGEQNPESALNKKRCLAGLEAAEKYFKTGELDPSIRFYNTAAKMDPNELSLLGKECPEKSLLEILNEKNNVSEIGQLEKNAKNLYSKITKNDDTPNAKSQIKQKTDTDDSSNT